MHKNRRKEAAILKEKNVTVKKLKKRIIAALVCVLLVISMLPAAVFGQDGVNYSVISPKISENGMTYSDNLLISVRVEPGQTLRFTLYNFPSYTNADSVDMVPSRVFNRKTQTGTSDYYSAKQKLSFYVKRIDDISPGLYDLVIETLDENGDAMDVCNKKFIVQPSAARKPMTIYQTRPSGRVLFFQGVFKSIFGTADNNAE